MKKMVAWFFPLTLLAFSGVVVHFLSVVFNDSTRWIFLLLLSGQTLLALSRSNRDQVAIIALCAYLVWCVMTSSWSESFYLSVSKSIALVVVVFSMVLGGKTWALRHGEQGALDYLLPVALVGLAAGGLGYFFSPSAYSADNFQGYVYGANMFGALLGIGFPWFLWHAYLNRRVLRWRFVWIVASGLVFLFILMSQSRAALLMALFTVGGLVLTLSKRNLLIYTFSLTLLVLLTVWVRIGALESAFTHVVYKKQDQVFTSREEVFAESWIGAQRGGWLGIGYGVSIDADPWSPGLKASTYGREKGNSQLAIVEETGVVGLCLYLFLLIALGWRMVSAFRHAPDLRLKVLLGMILGSWFGMHAHALFEGWWVAPGSPESVAFWALTGVALGLSTLVDKRRSLMIRGIDGSKPA